jgi:hypothetical protein
MDDTLHTTRVSFNTVKRIFNLVGSGLLYAYENRVVTPVGVEFEMFEQPKLVVASPVNNFDPVSVEFPDEIKRIYRAVMVVGLGDDPDPLLFKYANPMYFTSVGDGMTKISQALKYTETNVWSILFYDFDMENVGIDIEEVKKLRDKFLAAKEVNNA